MLMMVVESQAGCSKCVLETPEDQIEPSPSRCLRLRQPTRSSDLAGKKHAQSPTLCPCITESEGGIVWFNSEDLT